MPAQAERILVAGGHEADAPDADQRVELVRQRHALRDRRHRQRVACEARPVVLLDGSGNVGRLAVVLGVIAAHQALQFREFADHVGDQVRFRKPRRALRQCAVRAQVRRDGRRDGAHARRPIRLRAELVVIDDAAELGQARFQRMAPVLVEEELGVGQPRAQHALVAGDDRRRVRRLQVAHQQEPVDELPRIVGEREVPLVQLHREDEAFLRDVQERGVERAGVDDRPFDQRRDFVQQRIRHDRRGVACRAFEADHDGGAARGEGWNDLAFGFERRRVGVGGRDRDVAAGKEAMAAGHAAGGEVERAHVDHVGAVKRHQLVRGADELDVVVVAAGCGVAHHLRDGQFGERFVERFLQSRAQGLGP